MQRNLLESSIQVFYYCKLRVKIALWIRWSSAAVICTLGLKEVWWEQIWPLGALWGLIQRNRLVSLIKIDGYWFVYYR